MIRNLFALLAGLVLLPGASAVAADWPEFRGPTGQGLVSDGSLPIEWGKNKNLVWKQALPGTGWSSPIVSAGRIYLTASVPAREGARGDQSLRALCLDAAKGTLIWTKEVFLQKSATAPGIHPKNSHASPTPLLGDKRLYVHFGHQGTACLDLDGKVLWRQTRLKYRPVHGNGGTPVLVDDALIFSCDGGDKAFVAALSRKDGKVLWTRDRSVDAVRKFSFSTPLVITVKGQKQVISPGTDMVAAYDPRNGQEIWKVRYDGYSVIPRPLYGHGLVFICTGYGLPSLMAIRPDGKGDVTETHVAWQTNRSAPHTPSPLLVGAELYMVSDRGIASCLDAKTGRVHWQKRIGETYSASPIYADGKVYFLSERGTGVVIKAAKKFKELARNELDERALASYAAVKGALFIRTKSNLYRFEAR